MANGDFEKQLDKLIDSTEKLAVSAVEVATKMQGINDRLTRLENASELLIKDCMERESPMHKAEICPYKEKHTEYDRILFGGPDSEGLSGRMSRLERQVSWYKGALYIIGTLTIIMLPSVIAMLILFLKHVV
jgi:hypothetical protein